VIRLIGPANLPSGVLGASVLLQGNGAESLHWNDAALRTSCDWKEHPKNNKRNYFHHWRFVDRDLSGHPASAEATEGYVRRDAWLVLFQS
jgi:hypothetical protein